MRTMHPISKIVGVNFVYLVFQISNLKKLGFLARVLAKALNLLFVFKSGLLKIIPASPRQRA